VPSAVQVNGFATPADEKQWATDTLTKLAADNQSLLTTTPGGQFLAIRPPSLNTIYSMSWVPNYANATRKRLIKSEYIFSTYHPANAILTGGDIDCCSSYNVGLAPGVPTSQTFSIHTNGNLNGVPSPVSGQSFPVAASATGTCSAPCVKNSPTETIPDINPRDVYNSESPKYAGSWYDLCPDGKVRAPNTAAGAVPCTGDVIPSSTLPFRGWSKSGATWTNSGGDYPGVYYVYKGNIDLDKVDFTGAMTLITESTYNHTPAKCTNTRDGWQDFKKVDWMSGGFIAGLMVVSGDHVYMNTQTSMGTGAVVAQSYVEQQTSSSPGLYGLVIAENYCPGETNRFQGSVLYYDGGDDIPLGAKIRSTLELELL
jgi:hypothetical protein